jgi:excisionase family DNA binding protein
VAPLPPLYSVAQVAEYLGVSTRTVNRLIARGELAMIWPGRSLRITEEAVLAYIRKR